MKYLSMLLLTLGVDASAEQLDWNQAIDTGGVWTAEIGHDQPGEIRSLIGRVSAGRHNQYSVNIIINDMERVELLNEMADALPKVSFISDRIVVKMSYWPVGADKPVESLRCFGWNATSRGYQPAICP